MKIHFSASEHDEAKSRLQQLTDRYGQTDLPDATHIVALGGDGHMLHVLQDTMSFNLPVFGLNCGRLGFLMNLYNNDDDLPDRIRAAEIAPLHPLRMTATDRDNVVRKILPSMKFPCCGKPIMPPISAFRLTKNGRWIVLFVMVCWLPRQRGLPPIIYLRMAQWLSLIHI